MQAPLPVARGVPYPDRSTGERKFDPLFHLNLGTPEKATMLDFTSMDLKAQGALGAPPVPIDPRTGHPIAQSQLAFTSAFPVLTKAGIDAMRDVIFAHRDRVQGNERAPRHLRGLAYSSQFVRDISESPAILNHVSRLAGIPLVPHYMHGSSCHTNLSEDNRYYEALTQERVAGSGAGAVPSSTTEKKKSVDSWHVDSCPFVLIMICSDMTDMEGGILQAVKRKGLGAAREAVAEGLNSHDDVLNVNYVQAGWGMFMQGSEILHRVTGVTKSVEPRMSVVLSFMPASCVHIKDTTAVGSWLKGIDGKSHYPEAAFEFARGRAHRAQQQMTHFVNAMPFTEDREKLASALAQTAKELAEAAASLRGQKDDYLGFISDEEAKKLAEEKKKVKSKL